MSEKIFVVLTTRIYYDVYMRLQDFKKQSGRSISNIVIQALDEYLKKGE